MAGVSARAFVKGHVLLGRVLRQFAVLAVEVFVFFLYLLVGQFAAGFFDLDFKEFDVGLEFFDPQVAQGGYFFVVCFEGLQLGHGILVGLDVAAVDFDAEAVAAGGVFAGFEFFDLFAHFFGIEVGGALRADFFDLFQECQRVGFEGGVFFGDGVGVACGFVLRGGAGCRCR